MDAFSLLKYWKITTSNATNANGGSYSPPVPPADSGVVIQTTTTTTSSETETDDDDNNDDDGPFFDLELAVPDEEDKNEAENVDFDSDDSTEEGNEFKLTVTSSPSSKDQQSLALSESDDLFFKGKLVPIDNDSNSRSPHSGHFHVSLLKSATKFRVFMLRFKKPNKPHEKSEDTTKPNTNTTTTTTSSTDNNNNNKFFTVKFKVEEVPIVSLFTKDKQKQNTTPTDETSVSEEKRFSKDVMKNYFQKVKPLYVRVSKRYGDKLRFSGQFPTAGPPPATAEEKNQPEVVKSQKQGNLQAGMKVVCKRLGKSRSASAAAAAKVTVDTAEQVVARRRDDSLLEQQDGIQGAILHCKRSFNGSRDTESSVLSRSVSDPYHEKSIESQAQFH